MRAPGQWGPQNAVALPGISALSEKRRHGQPARTAARLMATATATARMLIVIARSEMRLGEMAALYARKARALEHGFRLDTSRILDGKRLRNACARAHGY